MRTMLPIAIVAFSVCLSNVACAGTWYVNGWASEFGDGTSPEKPLETIQEGIDAASNGDVVIVAEGTYAENVQFKGKNIVLTSTDPLNPIVVENTRIHGGDAGSVVTFAGTENETSVLSGFTIRNGNAETGGGVCGGTWESRTHATIENNVITVNLADRGAGLAYCNGAIQDNTITDNYAEESGGGLAYCDGLIRNNTVADNHASGSGGGLVSCHGTIRDNYISANSAALGGGLAACGATIQDNRITANSATTWYGGGLLLCDGIIQNNIIARNQSAYSGGGLMVCHGIVRNNTIVGNETIWGGGLCDCPAVIENCIIWGNTASGGAAQLLKSRLPAYSCIQDWTAGGEGNIKLDPQFVDFGGGDCHLSDNSPCIDAGANQDWMWDAVDPDGNPRVIGTKVDMGAYEYQTPTDTTPPYVSGREPAPDATRVLLDANIVLHVKDHGSGVDQTSIVMTVNGVELTPVIAGTPADYMLTYDPPSDFSYNEEVTVTVDAADLTSPPNLMEQVTYSFTTVRELSAVETWYVDGSVSSSGDGTSSETAFKTIQAGIDAADDGDTVIVARGTYVENIVFKGENITLQSTNPLDPNTAGKTVIDGRQAGPVVRFAGTEGDACALRGFTIRNGKADNGGGICGGTWANRTHARIENNVVTANKAANRGGGIAFCDGLIRNNGVWANSATGTVGETGTELGVGGGIGFCDGVIENNAITVNSGVFSGGGLAACGGIIQNNEISGNTVRGTAGGWPVAIFDCHGIIRNNLIARNSGSLGVVGLCYGAILNNTIVGNQCEGGGAAVACYGLIRNSVVWSNTSRDGVTQVYASSPASYSCIQSGPLGPGSISEDPKFVNAATGDYRPSADSPCIDKGKNEDWMVDAKALNGSPRIIDFGNDGSAIVDMGAYEAREFTPPVITLVGGDTTLECGAPYVEPGYSATDNYDGDITDKVVVTGSVNSTSPGAYGLWYNVKDSSGNPAPQKVRFVEVTDSTPPVIILLGDNPMTIQVGTPYVEPGFTASDSCGGDVTPFVVVSGSVDSNTVGTYTLVYSAADWSANLAQVTRTVNVVERFFRIVEIVQPAPEGKIRLTWNSSPGATYTIWSSSDLLAGAWIEEPTVPSGGETTSWTDPDTTSTRKFYRIELK